MRTGLNVLHVWTQRSDLVGPSDENLVLQSEKSTGGETSSVQQVLCLCPAPLQWLPECSWVSAEDQKNDSPTLPAPTSWQNGLRELPPSEFGRFSPQLKTLRRPPLWSGELSGTVTEPAAFSSDRGIDLTRTYPQRAFAVISSGDVDSAHFFPFFTVGFLHPAWYEYPPEGSARANYEKLCAATRLSPWQRSKPTMKCGWKL